MSTTPKTPLIKIKDSWTKNDKRRGFAEFWNYIQPSVVIAVEGSFLAQYAGYMKDPTVHEIKDRTARATEIVNILRRDLKWSKFRIKDNIGIILRSDLAGIDLDLNSLGVRSSW